MFQKSFILSIISAFVCFLPLDLTSQTAPNFEVYTTEQDTFELYDYLNQDKVVVIEFFFTSCPPCAAIAPLMEPLYQSFEGGTDEVEFLLLSNKGFDSNSDVSDYAQQYGFTFPGAGQDGGALDVWSTYNDGTYGTIFGTPAFIVIARDKTLEFDVKGPNNAATIDSLSDAITRAQLKSPSAPDIHYYEEITSGGVNNFEAVIPDYPISGDTTIIPSGANSNVPFLPDSILETDELQVYLQKSSNPEELLNGVSTFDIALLLQFLLQLETPNLLQFAAADINNDGRLSVADIIALRRLILGLDDTFPNGRSAFQFYPDYQAVGPADSLDYDQVWDFPKEFSYSPSGNGVTALPFTMIKLGDLSSISGLSSPPPHPDQISTWINFQQTTIVTDAETVEIFTPEGKRIKILEVSPEENFELQKARLDLNKSYLFRFSDGKLYGYRP